MPYSLGKPASQDPHNLHPIETTHFDNSFITALEYNSGVNHVSFHLPDKIPSLVEIGNLFRHRIIPGKLGMVIHRSFIAIKDNKLHSFSTCMYEIYPVRTPPFSKDEYTLSTDSDRFTDLRPHYELDQCTTDLRKIRNFIATHISELGIYERSRNLEDKDGITIVNDLIYKHNTNVDTLFEEDFCIALWGFVMWLINTILFSNQDYNYKESLKIEEIHIRNVLPAQE